MSLLLCLVQGVRQILVRNIAGLREADDPVAIQDVDRGIRVGAVGIDRVARSKSGAGVPTDSIDVFELSPLGLVSAFEFDPFALPLRTAMAIMMATTRTVPTARPIRHVLRSVFRAADPRLTVLGVGPFDFRPAAG